MPWQERNRMESRRLFIERIKTEETPFGEACQEFGVSRKTGYKWWKRYRQEGREGLADQSRRPHHIRYEISSEMEEKLVKLRQSHPTWGARKLCWILEEQGCPAPPERTAHRVLVRHGLVKTDQPSRKANTQRFERSLPNELWQMDHKAAIHLSRWGRIVPFVVMDDHSRYLLGLWAQSDKGTEATWSSLWKVFLEFGLPQQILSDNDTVFHGEVGPSRIEARLMRLGIRIYHGAPYHPQSQGKVERVNRTLEVDVLRERKFYQPAEVQGAFDNFRECYNYERPHEALGLDLPGRHYRPSTRSCPSELPPMEYSSGKTLRKVGSTGYICWKGWALYVGGGLEREWVEVREQNQVVDIYYGPFPIHRFGEKDIRITRNQIWGGKV